MRFKALGSYFSFFTFARQISYTMRNCDVTCVTNDDSDFPMQSLSGRHMIFPHCDSDPRTQKIFQWLKMVIIRFGVRRSDYILSMSESFKEVDKCRQLISHAFDSVPISHVIVLFAGLIVE